MKIETSKIIHTCEDGTEQVLLYGLASKLNPIFYELVNMFPYDYRKTSGAPYETWTHNIRIKSLFWEECFEVVS